MTLDFAFTRRFLGALVALLLLLWGCRTKTDTAEVAQVMHPMENPHVNQDSLLAARPYSIQVAALSDAQNAKGLEHTLRQRDFPAFVVSGESSSHETLYRVRVGPFAEREEAEKTTRALRMAGYKEAFLVNHLGELHPANPPAADSLTGEGHPKQITFSGKCSHPRWSPSNREIAFFLQKDGKHGIYAVGTGGGVASRIVEDEPAFQVSARFAWARSGRKLAFVARVADQLGQTREAVYEVTKEGGGLRRLTSSDLEGGEIVSLLWSPDDRWLAVELVEPGEAWRQTPPRRAVLLSVASGETPGSTLRAPARETNLFDFERPIHLVGWNSANELLYLTFDRGFDSSALEFEIKGYDTALGRKRVLVTGRFPNPILPDRLLLTPGHDRVILAALRQPGQDAGSGQGLAGLFSVELATGTVQTLRRFPAQVSVGRTVRLSGERVLFSRNRMSLCALDLRKPATLDCYSATKDFTVSPSGRKICFVRGGNLFTLRIHRP